MITNISNSLEITFETPLSYLAIKKGMNTDLPYSLAIPLAISTFALSTAIVAPIGCLYHSKKAFTYFYKSTINTEINKVENYHKKSINHAKAALIDAFAFLSFLALAKGFLFLIRDLPTAINNYQLTPTRFERMKLKIQIKMMSLSIIPILFFSSAIINRIFILKDISKYNDDQNGLHKSIYQGDKNHSLDLTDYWLNSKSIRYPI